MMAFLLSSNTSYLLELALPDFCYHIYIIIRFNNAVLYRMAIRLTHADDLGGRVPHPLAQRSGQVRLIEIASLVNDIENRQPMPQQFRCSLGAFHLANVTLRQASGS